MKCGKIMRNGCLERNVTQLELSYLSYFNSLHIANTDSNLYCKYSERECFSKLNIEKYYFEYEPNSTTVSVKGRLKCLKIIGNIL